MDDNVNKQKGPHRRYKALHVVADTVERDEHLTLGVLVDGAFIPIAQHPLGYVNSQIDRWSNLGGTLVDSQVEQMSSALETRLANLERAVMAAGVEIPGVPPAEHATDE